VKEPVIVLEVVAVKVGRPQQEGEVGRASAKSPRRQVSDEQYDANWKKAFPGSAN
jgi:hypothetical protein